MIEARVWIEEMVGDGKVFNMHGGSGWLLDGEVLRE